MDGKREDPGFCSYGAGEILPLLEDLAGEFDGVSAGDDLETLHRMRVTTRRLRAGLRLFGACAGRGRVRRWRKEIRRAGSVLGEARDADVQIRVLQEILDDLRRRAAPDAGPGILRAFFPPVPSRWGGTGIRAAAAAAAAQVRNGAGVVAARIGKVLGGGAAPESGAGGSRDLPADPRALLSLQHRLAAIECLLLRTRQKRDGMQPGIGRAVDRLTEQGTVEEMREEFRGMAQVDRGGGEASPWITFRNAFLVISAVQERLLAFGVSLADPGAIDDHHAMRIAAKRLRYTLELLNGLYGDAFGPVLQDLRHLQDLLGEMHDCDVWVAALPAFIEGERTRAREYFGRDAFFRFLEPGLLWFGDERARERQRLHGEALRFWEDLRERHVWEDVTRTISMPLMPSRGPDGIIRIALMGDIHGNLPAMEAVLADAKRRGADIALCTGDLVGYGPFPGEVLRHVFRGQVIPVAGNFDRRVATGKGQGGSRESRPDLARGAVQWARKRLSRSERRVLAQLPERILLDTWGVRILVTHRSPSSPTGCLDGSTPVAKLQEIAGEAGADIVVTGHSHVPWVRQVDGVWFVNPGSAGLPYDGDPRASYAVLEVSQSEVIVAIHRTEYDMGEVEAALRAEGLPSAIGSMIRRGSRPRDPAPVGEGPAWSLGEPGEGSRDADARIDRIQVMAGDGGVESGHRRQVAGIALDLFDGLRTLHALRPDGRFLLHAAALLLPPDSQPGGKGSRKRILGRILSDPDLPLAGNERVMVGLTVFQAMKGQGVGGSRLYRGLAPADRQAVPVLAALLRVASALDVNHRGAVRRVISEITPEAILLTVLARVAMEEEVAEALYRGVLLEEVSGRRLVIRWNLQH